MKKTLPWTSINSAHASLCGEGRRGTGGGPPGRLGTGGGPGKFKVASPTLALDGTGGGTLGGGWDGSSAGAARSRRGGGGGGALERGGGGCSGQEKEGGLPSGHGMDSPSSVDCAASKSVRVCAAVLKSSRTALVSKGSAGALTNAGRITELVSNGSGSWVPDTEIGSDPKGSLLTDESWLTQSACALFEFSAPCTMNGSWTWLVSKGSDTAGAGEFGASRRLGCILEGAGPRLGTAGGWLGLTPCVWRTGSPWPWPWPPCWLGRAEGTGGGTPPPCCLSESTGKTGTPPAGAEGESLPGRGRGKGCGAPPFSSCSAAMPSTLRVRGVGVGMGFLAGGGGKLGPPSLLVVLFSSMLCVVRLLGMGLGARLLPSSSLSAQQIKTVVLLSF